VLDEHIEYVQTFGYFKFERLWENSLKFIGLRLYHLFLPLAETISKEATHSSLFVIKIISRKLKPQHFLKNEK